jgi:Zinc dependent phospholipase C
MRSRLVIFLMLVVIAMPRPASAWGFEAHKYIMRRAIALLPAEIRPFFQRYETAVVEHVIDPDLWRTAGWEEEPPRHFLDLDAYGPYPFTNLPRDYTEAVQRYGRDFVEKNGLVPWRSAEIYSKLVEAFTQKAGYSRDNIKFFSSVLTHYVSDAHVPFHVVLNYDGQLTGQWGIHSRFETELFERYESKLKIEPRPVTPVTSARDFVFAALLESFPLVQPLLEADKAAIAGRDVYDEEYFTLFFSKAQPALERRLADSITASASLIAAAWIEAGRLPLPLEQPRTPRKVRK